MHPGTRAQEDRMALGRSVQTINCKARAEAFRRLSYRVLGAGRGVNGRETPAIAQKHAFSCVLLLFLSLGLAIKTFKMENFYMSYSTIYIITIKHVNI